MVLYCGPTVVAYLWLLVQVPESAEHPCRECETRNKWSANYFVGTFGMVLSYHELASFFVFDPIFKEAGRLLRQVDG